MSGIGGSLPETTRTGLVGVSVLPLVVGTAQDLDVRRVEVPTGVDAAPLDFVDVEGATAGNLRDRCLPGAPVPCKGERLLADSGTRRSLSTPFRRHRGQAPTACHRGRAGGHR